MEEVQVASKSSKKKSKKDKKQQTLVSQAPVQSNISMNKKAINQSQFNAVTPAQNQPVQQPIQQNFVQAEETTF